MGIPTVLDEFYTSGPWKNGTFAQTILENNDLSWKKFDYATKTSSFWGFFKSVFFFLVILTELELLW